jgi:hypothetical protein
MKTQNYILFLFLCIFTTIQLEAQQQCMVLKPEIDGSYTGKCKEGFAHGKGKAQGIDLFEGHFLKGLPHGSGTYTWANGSTYTGEWEKGYRHGEGTMIFKSAGTDSILAGLWENDQYKGPKPPKPRVISSTSVDRYSFTKSGGIKNRVLVNIYQNGVRNVEIENFSMVASSGTSTTLGAASGYENITFPVTVKLNYLTWNSMKTARIYVIFEFEIFEPGDWVVDVHN